MDLGHNSSDIIITDDFIPTLGRKLVSDRIFGYLEKTIQLTDLLLACLGVITNSINIRVFVEQGIRNSSTNIGLFSLSVFDLLSCLLLISPFSCHIFTYTHDMFKYRVCQTHANYATLLSVVCYYCSNWTTVYISLERTLCVVIPLKVKLIVRPKITIVVIFCIFIFFSVVQMLYTTSTTVVWRFHDGLNQSLPYFYERAFAKKYLYIYSTLANTTLTSVAIVVVAINTTIMVYHLNKIKQWRNTLSKSNTSGDESGKNKSSISTKDVELVKSVTTVTCIFLVCLSMSHIPATGILVLPGMSVTGLNRNLFVLVYTIRIGFSLLNSSINFFFYMRVSSRYKEAFNAVFYKNDK